MHLHYIKHRNGIRSANILYFDKVQDIENPQPSLLLGARPGSNAGLHMVRLDSVKLTLNGISSYSSRNILSWLMQMRRSPSVNSYGMLKPRAPYLRLSSTTPWNRHRDCRHTPAHSRFQVANTPCFQKKQPRWLFCITLRNYGPAKLRDSIRIRIGRPIRFDSKVKGRFENFESPRLPRLPSYHKQHSLFNDKFQSLRHCYWDLYWA